MSVATYVPTNFPTQDPATYKSGIDGDFMVSKRLVDAYAPHAQATPDMTVALDPGFVWANQTVTEVAAQNTTAFPISSRNGITRIDRIVVDQVTGAFSVVTGTSLVPALPSGKMPVAQVQLSTASTAVVNSMLTDERAFPSNGMVANYQEFLSTGTFSWGAPVGYSSNSDVVIQAWAGGGGGSSITGGNGGGGASGLEWHGKLGQLSTAMSIIVGAGGAVGNPGTITSVGSLFSVYGGSNGSTTTVGISGAGAGVYGASTAVGLGGAPIGGQAGNPGGPSNYGGGGGGNAVGSTGGLSVYGGAGGGGGSTIGGRGAGGAAFFGGAGGGGYSTAGGGLGGISNTGGNGGLGSTAAGVAGQAGFQPGGGGGANAPGGDGEVRIWVLP